MDSKEIMNLSFQVCNVTCIRRQHRHTPTACTGKPPDHHYYLKQSKLQLILIPLQVTCFGALAHINWKTHFAGPQPGQFLSVTGSGELTVRHVAYHFKVTVKREITLCQPHALVAFHKNFVQSERKVLKAKRFVGERQRISAKSCLLAPTQDTQRNKQLSLRILYLKLTNTLKTLTNISTRTPIHTCVNPNVWLQLQMQKNVASKIYIHTAGYRHPCTHTPLTLAAVWSP